MLGLIMFNITYEACSRHRAIYIANAFHSEVPNVNVEVLSFREVSIA